VTFKTLEDPRLFGIAQGGLEEDLRAESIEYIAGLGFDGIAVGGLAVGEAREDFLRLTAYCGPRLPRDQVHYLMGVGEPADLLYAIARGFDLFDCVQPTRMAAMACPTPARASCRSSRRASWATCARSIPPAAAWSAAPTAAPTCATC